MKDLKVSASILSADFSKLGQEIQDVTQAGADYIHIDIMDGHFVPNLTIGPNVVKSIRPRTSLIFDVHLMITDLVTFIPLFAEAGADIITIHPEATPHIDRYLQLIKAFGKKAGIALNPGTSLNAVDYLLDYVDQILIMTVNPGFGGQAFLHSQLSKIANLSEKISRIKHPIDIAVDGGINAQTAALVKSAGANILVAGSAIFQGNAEDYHQNTAALRLS